MKIRNVLRKKDPSKVQKKLYKKTYKMARTKSYKINKAHRQYVPILRSTAIALVVVIGVTAGIAKMTNMSFAQTDNSTIGLQKLNPTSQATKPVASPSTPASTATAPSATATASTAAAAKTASSSSSLAAAPATTAPAPAAVSHAASLFTNTGSNVAIQAKAWASIHPNDASVMNRLAGTPLATWFGDWNSDVKSDVNSLVSAATNAAKVPTLVAYNIPERDCGGYSSGGASSIAAYQSWIASFAAGIGQRQAIVIVEPDALAGMDCLSASDQETRLQLLSYAVQTLQGQTKAAVYLDAGNPTWLSASTVASRLKAADVADATGFSLNISNFETTNSNVNYGTSISQQIGGKHFVIDTSRNGNGPASGATAWCNPDGRAYGNTPTLQTGNSLVDAYLWIKNPGESDGTCGASQAGTTAPAAGSWWPQYVLMLANNSN